MKKLILLSMSILLLNNFNLFADGTEQAWASYSGAGVKRLYIENSLQAPMNYYSGNNYSVYAVVASDFDVTNAYNIRLEANTGFTISIDLPTDRSSAITPNGLTFQMQKTSDGSLYNVTLYIRKINTATIPYSLNFGSSYPYNATTPDFNGWAYRNLANNTTPQLISTGSANSFYLAFNPSLGTDSLVCNYYASNDNTQTGLTASISASGDGVTWTVLKNTNNDLPLNSATDVQKKLALLLPANTKYIQYLLTAKGSSDPYIVINGISVKHSTISTGIMPTEASRKVMIYTHNNMVSVMNAIANEKIEMFNSVGTKLLSVNAKTGENVLPLQTRGIYLIRVGDYVKKIVL